MASPFSFTHYSMKDGLASNEVTCITQDRTGFLWIASNNGLQRFDGVQYKNFRHRDNDPSGIPNNLITQVHADRDDNLWVLSAHGQVGIFDKNLFTYKPVAVNCRRPELLTSAEKRLITDEFGNLFLLLRGVEVVQYDKAKGVFDYTTSFLPFLPEWTGITSLSQQPGTQKYWLGLQGGGIAIFNRKTGNVSYTGHNVEKEPAIDVFGDISFTFSMFDSKGRVWFENWGKGGGPFAVQYDPRRKEKPLVQFQFYEVLKSYHEVHGFLEETDGRIWMKGVQLLALFNEEEGEFNLIPNDYRNAQGIQYEQVLYLFEDREKNIWVATRHHGMYRCNPSTQYFQNVIHKHPLHNQQGVGSVLSFAELKNGDILSGAWGDGLYRYDSRFRLKPLGFKVPPPHPFPSMWSMHPSADSNTIWMSAQPGLFQFDQEKNILSYRNPAILNNRTIRQVVEDRQGHLWLGMQGQGVYRWLNPKNTRKDSIVRIEAVTNKAMINQLLLDSKGWLWVSSGGHGLWVLDSKDGKQLRYFGAGAKGADTAMGISFSGVLEYNDSLVFITTATEFFFFNRKQNSISKFPMAESLMGAIASHQKDNNGYIWIGTTNALYRFHPFNGSLQMFNRFNGINTDNFVLSAAYKRRNGTMLFGTDNSFIHFDPTKVKLVERHLPVAFTSLQIGKNELRIDSVLQLNQLTLDPGDNSLTVEFSSLIYAHNLQTQYKLDGVDDEWHTADRSQRAMFPFLPPGPYTLRLRTINADGIPSPNHTVLKIYIKAPFYQTWWFYSLLAVTMALLLYWFDRQRTRRKEALQKVRTDIATGLHEEVNTALNNINILSEIARLKSDREPQRAKEYLEQIHTKSHNMIIAMDDMLWSLDPQNDTMDKTINRIKEYTDSLMHRHGVLIELLIDKKVERLELNMKLRHEAFLLFKEGLQSLVMAGTKLCIVHLTAERARLLFTIEFENEGCDMRQLNNLLHRRDMEARLHALGAKLNVQVHKSRSVFSLQLPLGSRQKNV